MTLSLVFHSAAVQPHYYSLSVTFPALDLTTPEPPKVATYYESLPPLSESPSRSLLWLMKSIAAGTQKRRLSQTYDSTGYMVTAGYQLLGPLSTNPSY